MSRNYEFHNPEGVNFVPGEYLIGVGAGIGVGIGPTAISGQMTKQFTHIYY